MSSDAEVRTYFHLLEEHFIRLRGSPLLLSPEDWRQAEEWHGRGIPVELVLAVMEQVFARRAERGAAGKIHSLRYCAPAVEAAWEEVSSLTAPGRRRRPQRLDTGARLAALAAALPAGLEGRNELAARILGLAGETSEIEAALALLDEEIVAGELERLSEDGRAALEGRTRRALEALAGRMEEDELAEARARLLRQALRRQLGLPVLSLFSPEAAGGGD